MDKIKESANIIKLIYKKRSGVDVDAELVKQVCIFFNALKYTDLQTGDLRFLRYIASEAGVPQYYEMLSTFQKGIMDEDKDIHLNEIPVLLEESSLYTSDRIHIHKFQKQVLDKFNINSRNRFFLSASTSFGKTFLIYEIIRKMKYHCICLIFPTIALLSENIVKLYTNPDYSWIIENYKIHTLSEIVLDASNNIFIYTPERFLSFLDKHDAIKFDFLFVDEIYKIDNEFLVDDEQRENERDVAYRISTHIGLLQTMDCLLAGPYININYQDNNSSIVRFLEWAKISLIDYNKIEIVIKEEYNLGSKKMINVNDLSQPIYFPTRSKEGKLKGLVKSLVGNGENIIIYCSSKNKVEQIASCLLDDVILDYINTDSFSYFVEHLECLFDNRKGTEWIVTKALKKGVGVHHGLVPKYIQNEIINLFNNGFLKVLVVTTTITEGVNTTAKNMIVMSHKKGNKELKAFDAKNIEGRAGRFIHHFVGRIFILDEDFKRIVDQEEDILRHKFFDSSLPKNSVDYPYIDDDILSPTEKAQKKHINKLVEESAMPEIIIKSYKTISPENKLMLYRAITLLTKQEMNEISQFISSFNKSGYITNSGLDIIVKKIKVIVPQGSEISRLIELRKGNDNCCILTKLVSVYVSNGFVGAVNYNAKDVRIDEAVRKTAKFIFNTLKYQVVKYIGLFNLCYKAFLSIDNGAIDNIVGLDKFLMKIEYNASTLMGRKASDVGASFKVIDYFDYLSKGKDMYKSLDTYEKLNADKIRKIIYN